MRSGCQNKKIQKSVRWNGMLLAEVDAAENGEEFVGRTGFPLSGAGGGTASYSWTAAGLLKTDSARGISNTLYNRLGLPTSVTFADKSHVDFRYGASGELLAVSTYAVVEGSKRPVKVSERSYCGDFVFEGDSLLSVEFTGGYFDGDGNPHFRHADWQGNVAMVTDGDGSLEQHVGYYPYGEPWREPVGQSRLFGGKERLRDGALNDYDFKARRLNSALGIWSSPDPLARDFAATNPYVYCAANPVRFIDPSGCVIYDKKGRVKLRNTFKTDHLDRKIPVEIYTAKTTTRKDFEVYVNGEKKKEPGYNTNCHGYTFIKGQAWINDMKAVVTNLKEEYSTISKSEVQKGDIVIYVATATEEEKKNHTLTEDKDLGINNNEIILHSAIMGEKDSEGNLMETSVMHNEVDAKPKKHDDVERSFRDREGLKVIFFRKIVDDIVK